MSVWQALLERFMIWLKFIHIVKIPFGFPLFYIVNCNHSETFGYSTSLKQKILATWIILTPICQSSAVPLALPLKIKFVQVSYCWLFDNLFMIVVECGPPYQNKQCFKIQNKDHFLCRRPLIPLDELQNFRKRRPTNDPRKESYSHWLLCQKFKIDEAIYDQSAVLQYTS